METPFRGARTARTAEETTEIGVLTWAGSNPETGSDPLQSQISPSLIGQANVINRTDGGQVVLGFVTKSEHRAVRFGTGLKREIPGLAPNAKGRAHGSRQSRLVFTFLCRFGDCLPRRTNPNQSCSENRLRLCRKTPPCTVASWHIPCTDRSAPDRRTALEKRPPRLRCRQRSEKPSSFPPPNPSPAGKSRRSKSRTQ